MGYQRSNRVFAVLALCGAWGCAQIAGLTGNYQEGATGAAASGGVADGHAGDNASAGHGMSQSGNGGSSSSHGGMSGGLGADAGNTQAAGEAGMSEVGGGVSSAGHAGASSGGGGASSGSGGASAGSGGALGGGPSGGAPSAGAPNSGDCKVDADCASVGGKCVSLSPGGFRTCQVVVPLATTCNSSSDECCTDGTLPCPTGRCVRGPLAPRCGGLLISGNVCATLGCTTNADCQDKETCILAGTLDHLSNSCVPGGCRLDSDCKASPGGKCESVTPNCCAGALGLYCVYPTGGCRKNSDCPGGHCYIGADNVTAACVTGNGFCPG
jgi:hypothetical protein